MTKFVDKVILHIGIAKTGSTSIQNFLASNRQKIFENTGVYFSKAAGNTNHLKLTAYSADDHHKSAFRGRYNIDSITDLNSFRKQLELDLMNELKALRPRVLVLSNEHLHSRITTPDEIQRLHSLLMRLTDNVEVVMYFRRQDKLAVSHYSTLIKVGAKPKYYLPDLNQTQYFGSFFPYYYSFYDIYSNYANVFGKASLRVRIFEKNKLKGHDVVEDFLDVIGVSEHEEYQFLKQESNASLRPHALFLLRKIRAEFDNKESGLDWSNVNLQKIARKLEHSNSGRGPLPSKQEALDFYHHFDDQNHRLAQVLGCTKETLFSQEFDYYPAEATSMTPSFSDNDWYGIVVDLLK